MEADHTTESGWLMERTEFLVAAPEHQEENHNKGCSKPSTHRRTVPRLFDYGLRAQKRRKKPVPSNTILSRDRETTQKGRVWGMAMTLHRQDCFILAEGLS